MKIDTVHIKNFRSIEEADITLKELTMLIGNNGTGKTSILEAIHFALSPGFLSGRIKQADFFNGANDKIEIDIDFSNTYEVKIPDGYTTQTVVCNKVHLDIKKRAKQTPGKSFSDGFVVTQYFVPVAPRLENGWEQYRSGNKTKFQFSERQLISGYAEPVSGLKSFYFGKNRGIQIKRGYNSSITNLFDDFNWRFIHNIEKDEEGYFTDKNKIEEKIVSKVDDKTIKKSLDTLNEKLKDFGIPNIGLSIFESLSPFNSAFLSNTIGNMNIGVDNLGSGIEMIISLMFLETLASLAKDEIIILIDEPELHLHPSLQEHFIKYLKKISAEKQIIVSTHSPYFFKNCLSDANIKLLITETFENKCMVKDSNLQLQTFPWSPSWGEINYFAYNLPTIEFFNELYGYLHELSSLESITAFDNYLARKGYPQVKKWINKKISKECDYTLFSFIRNSIHHAENRINQFYTEEELVYCIDEMIKMITAYETTEEEPEDDIPF
jgi:predicted ATP-dependent endonuclease of OLD family